MRLGGVVLDGEAPGVGGEQQRIRGHVLAPACSGVAPGHGPERDRGIECGGDDGEHGAVQRGKKGRESSGGARLVCAAPRLIKKIGRRTVVVVQEVWRRSFLIWVTFIIDLFASSERQHE